MVSMTVKTITDKDILLMSHKMDTEGLRRIVEDEAAPPLIRIGAMIYLGRMRDESAIGTLKKVKKGELEEWATRTIGEIGGPEAIEHLTTMLKEPTRNPKHFTLKLAARDALNTAMEKMHEEFDAQLKGPLPAGRELIEYARKIEPKIPISTLLRRAELDEETVLKEIAEENRSYKQLRSKEQGLLKEAEDAIKEFNNEIRDFFKGVNKR